MHRTCRDVVWAVIFLGSLVAALGSGYAGVVALDSMGQNLKACQAFRDTPQYKAFHYVEHYVDGKMPNISDANSTNIQSEVSEAVITLSAVFGVTAIIRLGALAPDVALLLSEPTEGSALARQRADAHAMQQLRTKLHKAHRTCASLANDIATFKQKTNLMQKARKELASMNHEAQDYHDRFFE